jgi:hypothetical protein
LHLLTIGKETYTQGKLTWIIQDAR